MQALLEHILSRNVFRLLAVDTGVATVLLENRGAGEAEELSLREEVPDGGVILTKLAAVALVENEDDTLVLETLQALVEAVLV